MNRPFSHTAILFPLAPFCVYLFNPVHPVKTPDLRGAPWSSVLSVLLRSLSTLEIRVARERTETGSKRKENSGERDGCLPHTVG
jgi:hypothetical protein